MEDKKPLIVKYKSLCGKSFYYPENETAKAMLSMSKSSSGKRKVFVESDLETLKELGFEVKILRPKIVYE